MKYVETPGFQYAGLHSIVPGVVLIARHRSGYEHCFVVKCVDVADDKTLVNFTMELYSSPANDYAHISLYGQMLSCHNDRFRERRNSPDVEGEEAYDVRLGGDYVFVAVARFFAHPMLPDGAYIDSNGRRVVKIGNKIYHGTKGQVVSEDYEPRHGTEGAWTPLPVSYHKLPENLLVNGVFAAISIDTGVVSLHRRQNHGIKPLDGFDRIRVSEIMTKYKTVGLTQCKDSHRIKEGTILAPKKQIEEHEFKVVSIGGTADTDLGALVTIVPKNHKEGTILPILAARIKKTDEIREFDLDYISLLSDPLNPMRALNTESQPEYTEKKNPFSTFKAMMETPGYSFSLPIYGRKRECKSLGVDHDSYASVMATNFVRGIVHHLFMTDNENPLNRGQDCETYRLIDGNLYVTGSLAKELLVLDPPQPTPMLHNGDLFEDHRGSLGIFYNNTYITLSQPGSKRLLSNVLIPSIARHDGPLVYSGNYGAYCGTGNVNRLGLPSKLVCRAGSWHIKRGKIHDFVPPGAQHIQQYKVDNIPVPIHPEDWDFTRGIPMSVAERLDYVCPCCGEQTFEFTCDRVDTASGRQALCPSCINNLIHVIRCTSCDSLHTTQCSTNGMPCLSATIRS